VSIISGEGMPKEVIPVKPWFIAEVEYLEFTPECKLRASVFKRLREDKDISECRFPE
jgi:bifunctional non-homologous end joining protein LigD